MSDHQPTPHTETGHPHGHRPHPASPDARRDGGFSFIEVLVTMVLLGILALVAVFGVRGLTAEAAGSTCGADERNLWTAAESFFQQHETDTIPATGVDDDRFERTLQIDGFLRRVSENHDLDASGATSPEGSSPCADS